MVVATSANEANGKPKLHPSYKEMILTAVGSLKERGGSSRRAISKFISTTYTDLPKKHDALLSCHLRRLRTKGSLLMIKHSYKLKPSLKSISSVPTGEKKKPGRPKKLVGNVGLAILSGIRKRGRPSSSEKKKPGRPKKEIEGPQKVKGAGRPKKVVVVDPKEISEKKKAGRPKKISEKKKPGRPKKVEMGVPEEASEKKKGGRPKKVETGAPEEASEKKKGGRPKKVKTGAPEEASEKKKGGRPKKVKTGAPEEASEKKKGGRPKKVKTGDLQETITSVEKSGDLQVISEKKKGRGRPKKE